MIQPNDTVSQKLKIQLLYDLAISLLGIYPKEIKAGSQRAVCMLIFISVLFTIAKRWKQSKWTSADEWMKKMWYVRIMEYYSP